MKNRIILFFFSSVLLMIFLNSCREDLSPSSESLEVELRQIIAQNGGLDFYTLPESQDFDAIPQDPNNPITSAKVALGSKLFFETGLAVNPLLEDGMETYSCASCHVPGSGFEAGIKQGIAEGGMGIGVHGEGRYIHPNYEVDEIDICPIRVPNNMNVAFVITAAWDGKLGALGSNIGTEAQWDGDEFKETNYLGFTGPETQAIGGLKFHRMLVTEEFVRSNYYKDLFDMAFPDVPEDERYNRITAGLAIAAYERTILTNRAPFQQWLKGDERAISNQQKQGAVLFFGKAGCINCHNSPSFNANDFHAVGMNDLEGADVLGDFANFDEVRKGRGGFTQNPADDYKFKTPQLYSLKTVPFLGHGGSFESIREVIEYKNQAIHENAIVPISQLSEQFVPLNLSNTEIDALTDFVENALYDDNMERYMPSTIASGNCFPNNDIVSRQEMNCE